jgi:VWFA-related protein
MRQAAFGLASALGICILAAALHAQEGRATTERAREIYVSALDGKGAPVPGLTVADVRVREDGAQREVLGVRPADAPMQLALLIDDSAAAMDATSHLRDGLAAFLERMHGRAEISLITVGDRPTVLAQYTKDTDSLRKQVARLFPRSNAGAYLLDAILDASRGLAKREAERPAIVAVTFEQGADFSNRHYQLVLDELQKSGATLHVVAIGSPSSSTTDEMRNRNIVIADGTERTGGRRDLVLAPSGLPDKMKQVADDLLNQYVVRYGVPDRLVPAEKVHVDSARSDVKVRARTRLVNR